MVLAAWSPVDTLSRYPPLVPPREPAMKTHSAVAFPPSFVPAALLVVLTTFGVAAEPLSAQELIRSARSGSWSAPATWEAGKLPTPAARVQIRPGHRVLY